MLRRFPRSRPAQPREPSVTRAAAASLALSAPVPRTSHAGARPALPPRRPSGEVADQTGGAGTVGTLEILFWAFCIFLLTNPFTFHLIGAEPNLPVIRDPSSLRRAAEGSQWPIYAIRAVVMVLALAICAPQMAGAFRALPRLMPLLAFALWAALSLIWTDAFATTLNAMAQIWPLVIIGFLLTQRLAPNELARAVIYCGVLTGVSSLLFALLVPLYGVHQYSDASQAVHAGAWRGIYLHKNHLGHTAAMHAAALLFASRAVLPWQLLRLGMLALFVALIFKSGSASPFAILLAAPLIVWVEVYLSQVLRLMALAYLSACLIIFATMPEAILELLGRDATLTGRTRIWSFAYDSILQQPVTGYGYMSPTYGDFTYKISSAVGVLDPHNGYFDLTLGLGIVGLVLFAWCVQASWRAARDIVVSGGRQRDGVLVLTCVAAAWLAGAMTESTLRPLAPTAVLGFIAICAMTYLPERRAGEA